MANFIEKILEEKSRGTESEVFYTQWLLAKDYIPKVHSVIVRIFPHYSLHDATHSEAVLNCIVRILGEEALKSLGPVDLWLLLSSAYYHDVGMAVYADDIVATLNDEEFLSFVKECQEDSGQALHPYAMAFRIEKGKLHFKDVALDGSTFDAPQFLMAEFIRRRHAQRSGESLTGDSSIHLAGDPIPNRIINLLRRICQSHAKSFSDVMSLPVCEAGLGLDDCHPRFVSCMLRLGDLLDLDNNRFSTVLLRTLPSIPRDSLLHHEKHLSIEHLRLDSRRIEVSARCKDYDVADITNRWLEMIGDEFRRQRNSWNDIVPSGFTGHLPMVGELKVDLDGYDTIDGNKRPELKIPCIDIVKGDEKSQSIGAASILAKVSRDRLMKELAVKYPEYGFEKHKGYSSELHREMILKHGPCEIHRLSFLGSLLHPETKKPKTRAHKTGARGEARALELLEKKGFELVERNYRSEYGEIDIIVKNSEYLVFVEVKTRRISSIERPSVWVDRKKQKKLIKTAQIFMTENKTELQPRFDIVEVVNNTETGESYLEHIDNAFDVQEEWI